MGGKEPQQELIDISAAEAGFADDVAKFSYRDHSIEEWICLVIVWVMSVTVFMQFFTRYFLNDSVAWTEEIASTLLIALTFVGSAIAVRKNTHIHIEFIYSYLHPKAAFALSMAVDAIRIVFFAVCTYLAWEVVQIMHYQRMVVIDVPLSYVYSAVLLGFAAMTFRAVQLAIRHWRQGHSALTRPAF